jgi:hypothetical protein
MHSAKAYGLTIQAEFPFPELLPADPHTSADVTVIRSSITIPIQLQQEEQPRACVFATQDAAYFYWDDIGKIMAKAGREIVLDTISGLDDRVLRLVILGPVMAALLHQRGYMVLHASVVSVDGMAVAFLGGKGWGKSTMAAAMHARGHSIVSDDIAAIDVLGGPQPLVHAAFPQLKLWPDSVASVGVDPESLPLLIPAAEKRVRPVTDGFSDKPLPLKRIYILAKRDTRVIEPISAQHAFAEMIRHSFSTVTRILEFTGDLTAHFPQCVKLVTSVPICRLGRPPSLETVSEVAQWIEEDIGQHT